MKEITKSYFNCLCGHRSMQLCAREQEWWSDPLEQVLGIVLLDTIDKDWSWVVLQRDKKGKFRAIDLGVSISTQDAAREALHLEMEKYYEYQKN